MASIIPHGPGKRSLLISYYYNRVLFRVSPGLPNDLRGYEKAREIIEKIELDIELDNHPPTEKEARLKYVSTEKKLRQARKEKKGRVKTEKVIKPLTPLQHWCNYQSYKLSQFQAGKIAEATYDKFTWSVERLESFPFNGEWELKERWFNRLTNNNKHFFLGVLSAFQNYSNKITGDNGNRYSVERSVVKREKKQVRKVASEAWLESFTGPSELKRYFSFLLYSSCRPNEALALTWDDIKGDRILIWRSNRKTTVPKNKQNRWVPYNEGWIFYKQLKEAIGEQGSQPNNGYIFNLKFNSVSSYLTRHYPELSPYAFRHGFADLCASKGLDARDTATLMGNSPLVADTFYRSAEAKLEGVIGRL
jgi:integrase